MEMSFVRTSRVLAAVAAAGGLSALAFACSSNNGGNPGGNGNDASAEATASGDDGGSGGTDANAQETGSHLEEAGAVDGGATTSDVGAGDAGVDTGATAGEDGGQDAGADSAPLDGGGDAKSDAMACVGTWVDASWVTSIVTPDAGSVILHAAGTGTQNYECEAVESDAGTTYVWTFVGPQANLDDCNGILIGHHFASEAGASAPEWETLDGTYVIGSKKVSFTPDGGSGSVPWLLLEATSHGGTGTLENADWITRANTSGGNAPTTGCSESTVGTMQDVDYTADYFFWGP
jgi:hypothetical protein